MQSTPTLDLNCPEDTAKWKGGKKWKEEGKKEKRSMNCKHEEMWNDKTQGSPRTVLKRFLQRLRYWHIRRKDLFVEEVATAIETSCVI